MPKEMQTANARTAREATKERAEMVVDAGHRAAVHKGGFDSSVLNVPSGTSFLKLKKGNYRLEMVPWKTSKAIEKFHKDIQNHHKGGVGSLSYEQTFWTHPYMGADDETVICLKLTFSQPCPICRARGEMMKDPGYDKDAMKKLMPKERQAFWVINLDEIAKGPQIVEMSFHNFGKLLDKRVNADNNNPDGTRRFFADPNRGSTLIVEMDETTMGNSKPFAQASAIDFQYPRKKAFNKEWLKLVVPLSDCVKVMTYEEVNKVFNMEAVPTETDDSTAPAEDPVEVAADEVQDDGPIAWEKDHIAGFEYKGEQLQGVIVAINTGKGLAQVQVEGRDKPSVVKLEDLYIPPEEGEVNQAEDPPADDDWGTEETTTEAPTEAAADDDWGTGDEPAAEEPAVAADDWGTEEAAAEPAAADDSGWDDTPAEEPAKPAPKPAAKKPAAAPVAKPAPKPAAKAPAAKPAPAKPAAKAPAKTPAKK